MRRLNLISITTMTVMLHGRFIIPIIDQVMKRSRESWFPLSERAKRIAPLPIQDTLKLIS
jgi:hypothetical protein